MYLYKTSEEERIVTVKKQYQGYNTNEIYKYPMLSMAFAAFVVPVFTELPALGDASV